MAITTKDKVALLCAICLATAFGYLSFHAGGLAIGEIYAFLIVPLVVIFIADQRKTLVWQACIIPFAFCIVIQNAHLGGLGRLEGLTVFFMFWAMGTLISSPVPIIFYLDRGKERKGRYVEWIFLGLLFVGLIGILWGDPFLFVGLALLWLVTCLVRFAWQSRATAALGDLRVATFVVLWTLLLLVSSSGLAAVSFKQPAFRLAMTHHYYRMARVLVAMGADPNARDGFGQTALVDAAWDGVGDLDGVRALISMGANVNLEHPSAIYGMLPSGTALHVAAAAGRTEICVSLLQAGADVDKRNQSGTTPLVIAMSGGSMNCVPALLDHGAEVNTRDIQGRTPLMLLMQHGPDNPLAQAVFHELIVRGADLDTRDNSGKTAEDWATYYRHELFAEQLQRLIDLRSQH